MAVFLKGTQLSTEKIEVTSIHYMPFDEQYGLGKTVEELELDGILVDTLDDPQNIDGKYSVLFINPKTKKVWYEYLPEASPPVTTEQRVTELEIENADLWYESMVQSAKVASNETEVAALWYEFMTMGGV